MALSKTNKWIILSLDGIIYIVLVIALKFTHILSNLTFIFLLSIAPIILINIYFILEKDITKKFKIILPIFSSVVIIAYCYIFLFSIPVKFAVVKRFNNKEIGILLYNNIKKESGIKIDLKNIRKNLEEINTKTLIMKKSIRIEAVDEIKMPDSEAKFDAFIQNEITNLNASVGIVIYKAIDDSVYSKIYTSKNFIEREFTKTVFVIVSSSFKLADVLNENIESLLLISKADTLTIEKPITMVEKVIISNHYYAQSTKILEKLIDIPKDSPEREEKVSQAVAELKKSIQLDSLNDRSLAMLAYIKNAEESKHDSAVFYYEKAKQIQPQSYAYTWNLAQSYYLAGEIEKANNTLKEYLDKYGNIIEDVSQKLEMEKLLRSYQEDK